MGNLELGQRTACTVQDSQPGKIALVSPKEDLWVEQGTAATIEYLIWSLFQLILYPMGYYFI